MHLLRYLSIALSHVRPHISLKMILLNASGIVDPVVVPGLLCHDSNDHVAAFTTLKCIWFIALQCLNELKVLHDLLSSHAGFFISLLMKFFLRFHDELFEV